jgi:hypothetical protein
MIIENSNDLIEAFKFLVPGCRCGVWQDGYGGETEPLKRFGMLVDWLSDEPCPTEKEVTAIDQNEMNAAIESRRKAARDAYFKNDLSVISGYAQAKIKNPDLTFTDYLDDLEAIQKSL